MFDVSKNHRFLPLVESSIRIMNKLFDSNRYFSYYEKIDTIMIRTTKEKLILSRFALKKNRYYHDSDGQRIDSITIRKQKRENQFIFKKFDEYP